MSLKLRSILTIEKFKFRHLIWSTLHAVLMILILGIWTSFSSALDVESFFFKLQLALKRDYQKFTEKPVPRLKDALLIDVSDDLVSLYDTLNDNHVFAANRSLLDSLFTTLNSYDKYKFTICDLYFDVPSHEDEHLFRTISCLQKVVFPRDANNKTVDSLSDDFIKKHSGYTSYNYFKWVRLSNDIIKFKLINEKGEKSLPLIVYQDLTGKELKSYGQLIKFKQKNYLTNNITLDGHVRNTDLTDTSEILPFYKLRDFLMLIKYSNPEEKERLINNKIILIGDLRNDMHPTAYGEMPGILILYNIVISLLNQDNEITFSWLLFILFAFIIISYLTFYSRSEICKKAEHFLAWLIGNILGKVTFKAVGICIISLFSYFFFHKNIEVIVLSFWLSLIGFILQKYRSHDGYFLIRKKTAINYFKFITNLG